MLDGVGKMIFNELLPEALGNGCFVAKPILTLSERVQSLSRQGWIRTNKEEFLQKRW